MTRRDREKEDTVNAVPPWDTDPLTPNDLDWDWPTCVHCGETVEWDGEYGLHQSNDKTEKCWRVRFPDVARKWDEGETA